VENLALTGIRSPDRPALASRFTDGAIRAPVQKLYRLNILANYINNIRTLIQLDIFYNILSRFSPRRLGFKVQAVQAQFTPDELTLGQLLRHIKTLPPDST
jgi:hypothetical protein